MSSDELEQLLDENLHMKNQRKWVLVTLGLAAGLVAWGMMRGHDAPKADAETAETDKPKLAVPSVARRLPSPLVASRQEPATPEPEQQPVTPEQDQAVADPPTDAGNEAAAAPQATVPQAVTAPAPTPRPQKWQSFGGSLSIGGGNKLPGYPYYGHPYYGPYRGFGGHPAPFRGGFRPAPAPFRSAPLRGGGFRSFGGGRRR